MIHLPNGVRSWRLTPMDESVELGVSTCSSLSKYLQVLGKSANEGVDSSIARGLLTGLAGKVADLSINGTNWDGRLFEAKAFNDHLQGSRNNAANAAVLPRLPGKGNQPMPPVSRDPALQGPKAHSGLLHGRSKLLPLHQVRLNEPVPEEG